MALKTFTATRTVTAGDSKRLSSWSISNGGTAAVQVTFCDKDSGTPLWQIQLPTNASAGQVYSQPFPVFPNGLHIEVANGPLNRGAIDLV